MDSQTVQIPFTPFPHQRAVHALRIATRFLVLVWHRRAGKTVWSIVELVMAALKCTRERGRYGYIAPFLRQAKGVAWDYLKHFTAGIPGTKINEAELFIEFANGARVRLFGADNPDSLRGLYFDGVVVDEVADMRPQVWGEIIRPALADRQGWAVFIGTPKGINLFSELYFAALKGLDGWAADMRRATDTGVIPAEELELARKTMSPQQYAQEFDCDFAAAVANALILLEDVLAATRRSLTQAEYFYAPKVLGIDVARYGDDQTVFYPRQGQAGMEPKKFRGLDTMEVAGQAAMAIDKWQPHATFIDQGGIGAGVIDRLLQLGYSVVGVDFGGKALEPRFDNKTTEMWWALADWLKTGGCIPNDTQLISDLTARTYTYANARGKCALESKDDMRKRGLSSPDIADALALTFAFPVPAPVSDRVVAGLEGRRNRVKSDFDPYNSEERV